MTPPRRDIQNSLIAEQQDDSGHPTSSGSNQISPIEYMNARMMKEMDLLSGKFRQLEIEIVELRCYMIEIKQYLRDLNECMIVVKSQNNNILQTLQSPAYFPPPSAQYNGPVVPSISHPNQRAFFAHNTVAPTMENSLPPCYSSVPPSNDISTTSTVPFATAPTIISGTPSPGHQQGLVGVPIVEPSSSIASVVIPASAATPTAISTMSMKGQQDLVPSIGKSAIEAFPSVPSVAVSESSVPFEVAAAATAVSGMPLKKQQDPIPEVGISTVKASYKPIVEPSSPIPSVVIPASAATPTAISTMSMKGQQDLVPSIGKSAIEAFPSVPSVAVSESSVPFEVAAATAVSGMPLKKQQDPIPEVGISTVKASYNVVESVIISEDNKTAVPSKSTLTYDTETSSTSSIKASAFASSKPEMTSTFQIGTFGPKTRGEFSLNTQKSNLSQIATVSTTAALQKTNGQLAERNDASGAAVSDNPEEKADVHFEPIIPLPDKVPIVTGEEDEIVLYKNHAKLFRHVKSDWKETGIGNIKILRHQQTGKIRLLMRRDGILNICLNHYMFTGMGLKKKSERSYVWCALDFSKGVVVNETFAIMFKTADKANGFKLAFENAVKEMQKLSSASTSTTVVDTPDDDVVFVCETEVSEEDKLKALTLKLPPNFFAYKINGRQCSGCIGCDDEDKETVAGENDSKRLKTDKMSNDLKDSKSNPITSASSKDRPAGEQITFPSAGELIDSAANSVNTTKNNIDKPIVPVPDIVEVKTGVKDEEILFRSRAKLYRHDGREWKERGMGVIKILRDAQNETYRLLMKRDEIFKTVLNQRLSGYFKLEKMATSSWRWIGMNIPEERNEPVLETLSIRFKNEQLANQFRDEIGSCITAIIKRNK